MKASEHLDKIADGLQDQRYELRRLGIGLTDGRTLELVEFIEVRMRIDIQSLRMEAALLRRVDE